MNIKVAGINKTRDILLMILLLFMSGNPIISKQSWADIALIIAMILTVFITFKKLTYEFIRIFLVFSSVYFIIIIFQTINFNYLPLITVSGLFVKILFAALVFNFLKDRFGIVFFKTIYILSIISLPIYFFHLVYGNEIVNTVFSITNTNSIGFYTFRFIDSEKILRNSGPFWEPGVFQSYINLCLLMNIDKFDYFWKHHRFKFSIIIFSLLTTQSTTGYIVFFLVIYYYLIRKKHQNLIVLSFISILFLSISFYLFNSLPFLGDKIFLQFDNAKNTLNEFTNDRFGSFIFDIHYILKHPIIGNGLNEVTRYADHPWIIQSIKNGENLAFSNGFSNFIATMGILGLFWYILFFIYSQKKEFRKKAFVFMIFVIIILQGEPLTAYPFFYGIPFYIYSKSLYIPYSQKKITNK